ncbi:hypothetical protein EX30DRAFT_273596 [Ascodesmis nigricans]|uniref:Uncharacterized protein n=1 Tax=Ascodesmis nigricans TaxID=341454 RepID=A0A4S2MXM6_9PEZI|nr:hypothetical protein EX30DRAFT_273596 [Ascodesmis nigricans]
MVTTIIGLNEHAFRSIPHRECQLRIRRTECRASNSRGLLRKTVPVIALRSGVTTFNGDLQSKRSSRICMYANNGAHPAGLGE